jgi:nucleotide-binding universal stress UspA family protein
MTDLLARSAKPVASLKPKARMENGSPPLRVLAVVDGTECAGRVTKYLLDMQTRNDAIEVVLLNVQPEPEVGRLRGYGSFRRVEIDDRLINDLGKRAVTSASRHLAGANIVHEQRIELGDPAETIVRCADEERCDLIVLAEPAPDAARQWIMRTTGFVIRSVASVVIHFAKAPVLVAK